LGRIKQIISDMTHGNFESYRNNYADMSESVIRYLYAEMYNPDAPCYASVEEFEKLLRNVCYPSIVELGCHRGHLAKKLLSIFPNIQKWYGFDINPKALKHSIVDDSRFVPVLTPFTEFQDNSSNVFISSHTLEHLSTEQVTATLTALKHEWVFLEMPITENGQEKWKGRNTHVLTAGRKDIRKMLKQYNIFYENTYTTTKENWVIGCRLLLS